MKVTYKTTAVLFLIVLANLSLTRVSESSGECKAWLVQSIPTDMPDLPLVPGVLSTGNLHFSVAGKEKKTTLILRA